MSDREVPAASSSTDVAMPAARPSGAVARMWGLDREADHDEVLRDLEWLQRTRADRLRDRQL
ncbi:hypothetical protein ACFY7V_03285 [[Kitasatospora] papulosa]|uniref:hypothetical protein n=1 Tax=Streptomyces TaxID=1883 RepID=UPI002FF289FF